MRPQPGETVTAPVELKPVQLTFIEDEADEDTDEEVPIVNALVTATIGNTSGCGQTQFTLGRTDSNGVLKSSLPYGQWTVGAGGVSLFINVAADGTVTYPLVAPQGSG